METTVLNNNREKKRTSKKIEKEANLSNTNKAKSTAGIGTVLTRLPRQEHKLKRGSPDESPSAIDNVSLSMINIMIMYLFYNNYKKMLEKKHPIT